MAERSSVFLQKQLATKTNSSVPNIELDIGDRVLVFTSGYHFKPQGVELTRARLSSILAAHGTVCYILLLVFNHLLTLFSVPMSNTTENTRLSS